MAIKLQEKNTNTALPTCSQRYENTIKTLTMIDQFLKIILCSRTDFFNLFFYWRIIALQNLVFCQTSTWISHKETVSDFNFLGSKITEDGDCSQEIKRHLLLGRKVMTNLDSIFKSRDITLPTKVCLVKAMVFSSCHVWMWELDCEESWAPKNWCFLLNCGVGEDSWESLGLQGDPTSPS